VIVVTYNGVLVWLKIFIYLFLPQEYMNEEIPWLEDIIHDSAQYQNIKSMIKFAVLNPDGDIRLDALQCLHGISQGRVRKAYAEDNKLYAECIFPGRPLTKYYVCDIEQEPYSARKVPHPFDFDEN